MEWSEVLYFVLHSSGAVKVLLISPADLAEVSQQTSLTGVCQKTFTLLGSTVIDSSNLG